MKAIIDRINGDIITAELADGTMIDIKHSNQSLDLKEGLCVNILNNEIVSIDYNITQKKLDTNLSKLQRLKNR